MKNSNTEILELTVSHLTKKIKKNTGNFICFPLSNKIKKDATENFSIIIEQAKKIISNRGDCLLCGLQHWDDDKEFLENFFADDLMQFLTEQQITVPGLTSLVYAQNIIPEKAAFNIARSRLLPSTYQSIDLANHSVAYQTYSIPFLIRLAIENKLKRIIGFVKSDIRPPKGQIKRGTQEFPVTGLIQELKKLKCLNLPCSLDDLQEIYKWSCQFCHTGKKEYLWLNLKAIEILSPLFSHDEHIKCQVEIQTLWGCGVLRPEIILDKLIEHKGPTLPLYYLNKGWSITKLEKALNNAKGKSLASYKFYLSESALDERSAFYCNKNNIHI
ncbi:hypothetical protein V2J67_20040 [Pseudomonas alliivorans]|nr:hypothetical protein [Pseudomonas alliivorans]MEE4803462.1 hypothetical protein [Pseudomonas alliivorans]